MNRMVCGLLFDEKMENVLLTKKNRPDWQIGKYNGVGGKVEDGETHYNAMVREFNEEAGRVIKDWNIVAVLDNIVFSDEVYVYYSVGELNYTQMEDEELYVFNINNLPETLIPNLKWIIPLCKYSKEIDMLLPVEVEINKRG